LTDSDHAALKYVARVLGDLRSRYRLNGLHWPPELEACRLLATDCQGTTNLAADANPGDRLLVTYQEAARRLSVSTRTVNRLIARGDLPRVMLGDNCPRITVEDLEAFARGLRRERAA
jgi:excisionase family DNA binding protein